MVDRGLRLLQVAVGTAIQQRFREDRGGNPAQEHRTPAFGCNVAAMPLAALGLLNPMLAGAAMAFSTVFVVGNSLRLRSFKSVIREMPRPPGRGNYGLHPAIADFVGGVDVG